MRNRKITLILALILFSLISSANFAAQNTSSPLPADEAFVLSVYPNGSHQVIAEWRIAPGYYLYRDRLRISDAAKQITKIDLPQAEIKKDAIRGKYLAYSGILTVPILLKTISTNELKLRIDYQGCSQQGFCYPPIQKNISLRLAANNPTTPSTPFSLLTNQNEVQAALQSQHLAALFLLFVGLGLLLAFTPCVLPMVPILAGIIIGQKQPVHTKKAFFLSCAYVLGMAITYALAGILAALLGSAIQTWLQKPWILVTFSGVFVLLAISLFGFYDLRLPKSFENRMTFWSRQQKSATYLGVLIMGILSTLIVSPCVTAPLVGVLIYIGQTGNILLGAITLFAMGLGMGLPLLAIGISAGKWLPKTGPWMEAVKKIFGILMLGMAIWLLSRIAPQTLIVFLWGMLLLGTAVFLGFFLPHLIGWPTLNRLLGIFVGISGMLLMLGSSVSGSNILSTSQEPKQTAATATHAFIVVHNNAQLNKELARAEVARKPVLLDFYADWCDSCLVMERRVFARENIKEALAGFVLLRADLSDNNADDEAMMKRFQVIAPPTVLFFDVKGRELTSQRIVGEVNAKEFLARLNILQD